MTLPTRPMPPKSPLVLYAFVSAPRWIVLNKVMVAVLVTPDRRPWLPFHECSVLKRCCMLDVPCGILAQFNMSTIPRQTQCRSIDITDWRCIKKVCFLRSLTTTSHPLIVSRLPTTASRSTILFITRPHIFFRNALFHPASAICSTIRPSIRFPASL
jgi:hypothetical protein